MSGLKTERWWVSTQELGVDVGVVVGLDVGTLVGVNKGNEASSRYTDISNFVGIDVG